MDNTGQWNLGLQPNKKLEQLSEITLRLARISLYRKLQNAESQLRAMGVPNNLSDGFKKSSDDLLKEAFKKPPFRFIQVNTTGNSVF